MFRVLINILILASVSLLSAGAQEVRGCVRDSLSGELLPGAFVMLMDSTGKVLEYSGTDSDGIYQPVGLCPMQDPESVSGPL